MSQAVNWALVSMSAEQFNVLGVTSRACESDLGWNHKDVYIDPSIFSNAFKGECLFKGTEGIK